jgi:natural product precursor
MKQIKKISLKTLSDKLSDRELRSVVGGYGDGGDGGSLAPCHCPNEGDCTGYCDDKEIIQYLGTTPNGKPITWIVKVPQQCVNVAGICDCRPAEGYY